MGVRVWAQSLNDNELHPLHVFRFPGGEWHIDVDKSNLDGTTKYRWIAEVRGASAEDLVVANLMADTARQFLEERFLLIPYLPAARADRGVPSGLGVYGDIINAGSWDQVISLDVHNPAAAYGEVSGLLSLSPTPLLAATVEHQDAFTGVIAPDAGAEQRAQDVASTLGVELVVADKKRDFATGKILGITCPPVDPRGNYLVVDDICDGGGTFMGLADATGLDRDRLSLWVTHGIFSGASSQLWEKFKAIYTTDSHPGSGQLGKYTVKTPVWPYMIRRIVK
ncbi:phosphoribosyl pyrophosphate transferase [Gordonia phage Bantam]|uniref:ribose-phosphate diphosphokinase n=1 Tax=Gordonia phage Bantam TaxID=1887641 RepID=A0A1B3AY73_9CAUD|nr:ribose-phosphate pyrophosphokinase [Gordonia phage Bantam]AOE43694.1 phosphoribosyl pyrophosphate transferase [Gordonia phage Bantam]